MVANEVADVAGMPGKNTPIYPIGSVEKLTGLTARQIRYYEAKGLIDPARTEGNQRLYTPAQVERLLDIKKLMAEGYNLKSIKEILAEEDMEGASLGYLDDYPSKERIGRETLRSLYPVSDRAKLMRILERRDEEKGR